MRIDIITLFPEMCEAVLNESIIGRARAKGIVDLRCHQLRDYAFDKHKRVDDSTYGGGMGMLMKAEPIALCIEDLCGQVSDRPHIIYLSPKGTTLTQEKVRSLAAYDNLVLLCGHYEGVDQRVLDTYIDEELSIGDYVLTGGELPALVLTDSICRMIPGVLSDDLCFEEESHYSGLLEYPQYTKPAVWRDQAVPEVLLSGHHANIERWRREQALLETARRRPDLLTKVALDEKDRKFLREKGILE